MQAGEIIRRKVFFSLDKMNGGKMKRLIEVNKAEIVNGIRPEYEERRLSMILDYARIHCAFYRNRMLPDCTLSELPVMNKMAYNQYRDQILSDEYSDKKESLFQLNTSGSTGVPFTVLADPAKMEHVFANMLAVHGLNGFRMGMKRGEFRVWIPGKNAISKFKSFKNNLLMYDISNMGDAYLDEVCRRLRRERIQAIIAYSSALTALTDYIERKQIDIRKWQVEMIFSMGEAMPKATYEAIERVFGFPPVRSYGNNENGFIAVCINGSERYYIDLYNYYIEILKLDSDEPAEPGELGRIVVTDYYNRAFPMIRYDTGDTGIMIREEDEAGRLHGYFTTIYGRRASMLYNTKGEPLSIHVFMNLLLKTEDVVHQVKTIQWEKDRYELLVNADREKLDEQALVESYRNYLGEDARIQVSYVDEIPIQASGKTMVSEQKCKEYL
ncbi:MAG: phenylacetate--CoA ligase family protein [Lachnospiraceae bacterium]|nr:phenylacetate--CoA ligase family protein [Lachnospiraceae bacterium]